MKKLILLAILISTIQLTYSQNQTVENEIINASISKSVLISKGRALLLDKLLAGDTAKVREIEEYLIKQANEDYLSLFVEEQWLIDYWTNNFDSILQNAKKYDLLFSSRQNMVRPSEDNLFLKLQEKLYIQKQNIEHSIEESALAQSDKDFLIMHFYSCLMSKDTKDITQDTLNLLADNFLQKYPNDEHTNITRDYIRYKLEPSNWGFAFEMFSGYGIFTGDIKNNFTNNVPLGVAFDISYKKLVLYLRDYIGFSKTKHNFTDQGEVWPENSKAEVFLPEASIGFILEDNKDFQMAPFIGISATGISPTENDLSANPNLKNYEFGFAASYSVGLNMDFKFGKPKMSMVTNGPEESNWFIRIRYGYNFSNFSKSYREMDGNMQYLTIGFGGFGRAIKGFK